MEQEIHENIYGKEYTVNAPCSMLNDEKVMYAATSPEMLSPDPKERLQMMKRVRQMLVEAKDHHHQILAKLQDPQPRQSERLKQKPRKNYTQWDGY